MYGVGTRKDEGELKSIATDEIDLVGDTILVLFEGETPEKHRLLDRYDARTGRYLGSYHLPFKTSRVAAGSGLPFARGTGGASILALRARP